MESITVIPNSEEILHFRNTPITRLRSNLDKYTDSCEKLEEESLPGKEEFYSTLTEKNVEETECEHAKNVWTHFNSRIIGEYSGYLYLKIDMMMLTDVFENFCDMCMTTHNLDPAYYTLYDAEIQFQLHTWWFGSGGYTVCKANNHTVPTMIKQKTIHGLYTRTVQPTLDVLKDLNDTLPIGRVYDFDITYLGNLHNEHNN
ncbi:Hypothetical protein CINCED_3A009908 [Cinara cedri]|uniref:Uncharacterized protein n=1 Tax=Cinara cedri TaxID=506608 RepID=A0A5E4NQ82_9HEMI|nr:Hypothetical protein CINCED_3A009908 [Cinara cedri]